MRVWILTSEMPQEIAGGIARYVENFARLLGAAGHEVVIIARTEHACQTLMSAGVRLIGIPSRYAHLHEPNPGKTPDTHPAYPYNILSYWPALSYQMAEEVLKLLRDLPQPDIIESQEYAALPYYLLQRKLTEQTPLKRIPLLLHLHSPTFELTRVNQEPSYHFPEYWVGQMEKFCLVAADALLSPSTFLARRVEQVLQQRLEITRIPLPFLSGTRVAHNEEVKRGEVLYIGRLELRKGVLPLVKACSRLWNTGTDFSLTLIGGDVEFKPRGMTVATFLRQRYANWIESGHLTLTGQLDQATIATYLQRAWTVVVPSVWENFPNTCMEAMGAGQVVLASRAGGQAEMIEADGTSGFLFDWHSAGDFERQLRTVLALSKEERQQIGQRACARIHALCSPEVILPQRLQHYETLIGRQRQRHIFPVVSPDRFATAGLQEVSQVQIQSGVREQAGLLSVIIPYYNLGAYVEETVASVLASTYQPLEVIIINDGSTETESLEVLREIEKRRLPQMRVVHTENQGLAEARNTGAETACGEFIAFVDADDLVEREFFVRAIDVLRRYANVMFVYSWVRYFGGSDELWPTWNAEFPYLLGHNMLTPLAVLRRGAFLRCARNQPEFEYNFEDFESWAALVAAGGVGVSLCQPLVCYRVRDGSMYRSATRNQKLYLYDLLSRRHAALYQRWGVELFNLQNANGPGYRWNYPAEDRFPLEEERDRLWSEVRRLAQNWEEQKSYIEDQQRHIEKQGQYLTQVEQERDRVWAEAQRLGQCWEEQKSFIDSQQTQITNQSEYIHQLEAERARRWSQRMRRLGRRVWQRVSK